MSEPIEWTVTGPLGKVILKKSTLEFHIQGDHHPTDAEPRMKIVEQIRSTVMSPRCIIYDTDSADADGYARSIYIDCELCDDKIKMTIAFIDDRKNPKEVASFLGTTKSIKYRREDVIYDRKGGSENEMVDSI